MINAEAKKVKDGWDVTCEISGRGNYIFNELRAIISNMLSDPELADVFTTALTAELLGEKKHEY